MSTIYQELAERIRGGVPDLEHVVQQALRAWSHAFADFLEDLGRTSQVGEQG